MSTQLILPETNTDSVDNTPVAMGEQESGSRLHNILANHMVTRSKKPTEPSAKSLPSASQS